jgi:hypothetical protein
MKFLSLLIAFVMMFSLVGAVYGLDLNVNANADVQAGGTNSENNSNGNDGSGIGQNLNLAIDIKKEELREGNYTGPFGQLLNVKELSAGLRELRAGNVSAQTRLNITSEKSRNETKFKAHLSNRQQFEIKIMPDRASETAIAKLRLNVCSEENNCTIELKEVGINNEIRASYAVKADKQVRVLGLFRAKMNVEANVDAETGEVISSKAPWWSSISASS